MCLEKGVLTAREKSRDYKPFFSLIKSFLLMINISEKFILPLYYLRRKIS